MVLLLAALVLLPLFWLAVTSVQDDAKTFTLAHYRQLVIDPAFVGPLWTTLWTSAAVGVACVITAAPMAWLVSRTDLPGKRWWRTLILASFGIGWSLSVARIARKGTVPRPLLELATDGFGIEIARVYGSSEAPNFSGSVPTDAREQRLAAA